MKQKIYDFLKKEYPDINFDVSYPPLPRRSLGEGGPEGFGDYSTNIAFLLARRSPPEQHGRAGLGEGGLAKITEEVIGKLRSNFPNEFEKIESAKNGFIPYETGARSEPSRSRSGFINFYLSKEWLKKNLPKSLDFPNTGNGKTVIIEYSQPNIAKFMHVGHLRSTILGDALANIYTALGYKVIRWNYLGDWGTQFGKLIAAYKMWGSDEKVKESPIETLNALYVRFHEELKNRPELEDLGRAEFKKLEEGDEENKKLWEWFRNESLKEFEKVYEILGIKFDTYIGESFFQNDLKPLVEEFKEKGIALESEGALIIKLDRFNLPPALIQRSDGASLYLTRDIAALKHRLKEYKPEKILYVVGNEQALHFEQLKAIAEIYGLDKAEVNHIKFGLILGENKKKLSSRKGGAIAINELIDKAIELSGKDVGIGALKYSILKEHRNTDIVFNWEKILDLKGDSGPYLQYTHARLRGIKSKAGEIGKADFIILEKEAELSLMKKIIKFPEAVVMAAQANLSNVLTLYLYELCNLANKFYELSPVIQEEDEKIKNARFGLVVLTASVLERGLNLLGIEAPERI